MIGYSKAAGLAQWIGDVVYNDSPDGRSTAKITSLAPAQREAVIIATVAAERDTFVLSGHLYWGLMEGLSVENLADILLTVASYSGINNFRLSRRCWRTCSRSWPRPTRRRARPGDHNDPRWRSSSG